MTPFLSTVLGWLVRQATTLLLIIAVLFGISWATNELKTAIVLKREREELIRKRDQVEKKIDQLRLEAQKSKNETEAQKKFLEPVLVQLEKDRQALSAANFWKRMIPFSEASISLGLLDAEIKAIKETIEFKARSEAAFHKMYEALVERKGRERDDVVRKINDIDEKLKNDDVKRLLIIEGEKNLILALGILAGVIAIPVGIKAFLYFVVAPLASGRAPVRLMSAAPGGIHAIPAEPASSTGKRAFSAVSIPIVLNEAEELLVLQDYLQSTSLHARKRTRWLLNAGIPFTSVLSGMYMLTEISSAGLEPVVVSATKDPLMEVGILALDDGAAFVCQPRSLAGVIHDRQSPVRISRHWRLGMLQSWLTLQFRFLVFHGPCRLVIKGCRGIVAEQVGTGRLVNQAATIGFDANLDYANTRCETFVSYWSGKEELFNDLFSGQSGLYVYEEMPDLKNTSGAGRHLKGIADAFLKAFGV